jgi:hypothetical protein
VAVHADAAQPAKILPESGKQTQRVVGGELDFEFLLNRFVDLAERVALVGLAQVDLGLAVDDARGRLAAVPVERRGGDLVAPALVVRVGLARVIVGEVQERQRARAVYEFLKGQGIPDSRMTYQGVGSANPVAPNDTEMNRAKNRRVEVVLTEASKAP